MPQFLSIFVYSSNWFAPMLQSAKHSHNRDAKHDLPGDFESNTKGIPHCVLQRLGQLRNNRDRTRMLSRHPAGTASGKNVGRN